MHEGTWKLGLLVLCFWPGGEAANPDALHPGKVRLTIKSQVFESRKMQKVL